MGVRTTRTARQTTLLYLQRVIRDIQRTFWDLQRTVCGFRTTFWRWQRTVRGGSRPSCTSRGSSETRFGSSDGSGGPSDVAI